MFKLNLASLLFKIDGGSPGALVVIVQHDASVF
jgi:hypothetical protein